ncbi:MAG TPA: DUF4177 domain-containing protein [Myxococcales bacterium LLY-WYZ-16_1]|nr:DUF4177 domain-containing protein [Myxococcales bacterium LLY-WYZ-16_1]
MSEGTYKVVELSTVTDDSLEAVLNEWTGQGFVLQGIHFAMRESSRRPAMAFVVFTRPFGTGPPAEPD